MKRIQCIPGRVVIVASILFAEPSSAQAGDHWPLPYPAQDRPRRNGVVYEGWDDRLKRPVAVKTIIKANEGKEARSLLWREMRSLARVNHPNVCQVCDVLEEGESLVLILELLEGQSMADRLLTGMVTTSEALGDRAA